MQKKIAYGTIVRRFGKFEYKKLTCRSTSSQRHAKKKKPDPAI